MREREGEMREMREHLWDLRTGQGVAGTPKYMVRALARLLPTSGISYVLLQE